MIEVGGLTTDGLGLGKLEIVNSRPDPTGPADYLSRRPGKPHRPVNKPSSLNRQDAASDRASEIRAPYRRYVAAVSREEYTSIDAEIAVGRPRR